MSESPITVDLKGLSDVREAFKQLKDFLPKTPIRTAVRKAAKIISEAVIAVVPKDTGNLARNIVIKTKYTLQTVRGRIIVNTIGSASKNAKNAFYWRFLEFGFHTRSGEERRFPFLEGVFKRKSKEAAQEVIDVVEQEIAKAAIKARHTWGQ